MMEANEAMKAMADRIADKMYPRTHPGWVGGGNIVPLPPSWKLRKQQPHGLSNIRRP